MNVRRWLFLVLSICVAGCGGRGGGDDDVGDDDDDGSPLTVDEVVRAAVVFGSCVPDDGIADFALEYWDDRGRDFPMANAVFRCIATRGGGCDAVSECAGITTDLEGPCESSCSGTTYEVCDDQLRFRMDCSTAGLDCDPDRGCVEGPSGDACDYETYEDTCQDGRPTYCGDDVVEQGPLCADYGLECGPGPDGDGAVCLGTEGSCDPSSWGPWFDYEGVSCAGDTLTACVNGGLTTRDCAAVGPGFGCQTGTDQGGEQVAFCGLGSECVPDLEYRTEATCDGTVVTFCNVGRLEHVDCTDLGFTGCEPPLGCTPTGFAP